MTHFSKVPIHCYHYIFTDFLLPPWQWKRFLLPPCQDSLHFLPPCTTTLILLSQNHLHKITLSHPLFFIHLTKCAGTSLWRSLFQFSKYFLPDSEICISHKGNDNCKIFFLNKCKLKCPIIVGGHFNFEETKEILNKNFHCSLPSPPLLLIPYPTTPNSSSTFPLPPPSPPPSPSPSFNLTCITFIHNSINWLVSMHTTSSLYRSSKLQWSKHPPSPPSPHVRLLWQARLLVTSFWS